MTPALRQRSMSQLSAAPSGPASVHSLPMRNRLPVPSAGRELGTSLFRCSFADRAQGRQSTGVNVSEGSTLLASVVPLEKRADMSPLEADSRTSHRGFSQMDQQEFGLVGSVTRPMHRHPATELKACRKKGHACRLAVIHSGDDQDRIAERIGVSAGYLSMLLSGKRRWNSELQEKFERVTGSWAPFQWDAMRRGIDLHFDAVNVARASGQYMVEHAREAVAA